jgi:hypothetical protein
LSEWSPKPVRELPAFVDGAHANGYAVAAAETWLVLTAWLAIAAWMVIS